MAKLKGALAILGAIFLSAVLVYAWEMLGDYYVTFEFLPDVPLFGARFAFAIVIAFLLGTGIKGLFLSGNRANREE